MACTQQPSEQHRTKPTSETSKVYASQPKATPEQVRAFVADVDKRLRELWVASSRAEWQKNTNITDETEVAAAKANEAVMAYLGEAIKQARRYDGIPVDVDTARQLHLLELATTLPAPEDATKREELARLAAKMEGIYGKGKFCQGETCQDIGALSDVLADSRDHDALLRAWQGWHGISREIRPLYQRYVELANEGARNIGYADLGELWRSSYDMSPQAFEQETERLWGLVKPLYDQLHCYVRAELSKKYGKDKVSETGAIPAHLLGNMWAQDWSNVYQLVEPYKGEASLDVTAALKKNKYDEIKLVKLGESFFTSLGMDPLPQTFWERSMFKKPSDREVVCHASAWDVEYNDDLRIKMCIKINHEELVTIHHELGHDYYFHHYYKLPVLYQSGAHDGFHEAIGDALALSVTPEYLVKVGVLRKVSNNEKGLVNKQMQDALSKIAFLPFGKLIDQWRWNVFAGKITSDEYNASWWQLRHEVQGVDAPIPRSEQDFDPGAKYHIPANIPYMRYFLARILQFQFHAALCEAAGHQGPLHTCSIHGNKEAGKRLANMLSLGASKPWPDALEALTGQREMNASALLGYFEPLAGWLAKQNEGRTCGW